VVGFRKCHEVEQTGAAHGLEEEVKERDQGCHLSSWPELLGNGGTTS
jgi:hypothetical protein